MAKAKWLLDIRVHQFSGFVSAKEARLRSFESIFDQAIASRIIKIPRAEIRIGYRGKRSYGKVDAGHVVVFFALHHEAVVQADDLVGCSCWHGKSQSNRSVF